MIDWFRNFLQLHYLQLQDLIIKRLNLIDIVLYTKEKFNNYINEIIEGYILYNTIYF